MSAGAASGQPALTDADARPVATDIYAGNVGDPTTVPGQVETLRSPAIRALVVALSTRCQHTCRLRSDPASAPVHQFTPPTPLQAGALDLLRV
jgi:hypothetical protein